MPFRFHEGDQVRIREDLVEGDQPDGNYVNDDMLAIAQDQNVYTIRNRKQAGAYPYASITSNTYHLNEDVCDWNWSEDMLIPVGTAAPWAQKGD